MTNQLVKQAIRQPKFVVPLAVVVGAVILLGVTLHRRSAKIHWAREQAIPEISELIQKGLRCSVWCGRTGGALHSQ